MKTKVLTFLASVVVFAIVCTSFYQLHRHREAVQSLVMVRQMTPGKTRIDEVREFLRKGFSGNANCPGGTCTFTKSFDTNSLERVILRKHLSFELAVSVDGGLVANTSTSLKVIRADSWVGAAVLRSRFTTCDNPESSCTFVNVGDDRRIPMRIVTRLPANPLREITQSAYSFELKCLLPFRRCATVDDIYPDWQHLPDLPQSLLTSGK